MSGTTTNSSASMVRVGLPGSAGGIQEVFDALARDDRGSRVTTLNRQGQVLISARNQMRTRTESGNWELLRLAPDLFVVNTDLSFAKEVSFSVAGEDFIELHFRLSGRLSLMAEDGDDAELVNLGRGILLIWRQPHGVEVIEHVHAGERENAVTIYMRPSVIERYFGDCLGALAPDVAQGLGPESPGLFFLRMAPYPRLIKLVRELSVSRRDDGKRLVEAEALVMMILCEVLTMLEGAHEDSLNICRLTDADVRCLRQARELIRTSHTPPPTIDEIARHVGLGATKLKSGFKALFGKSISRYANDLRMALALDLLQKSDISILHVAEMLGYEYQNSFTVAFRRQFNILPKDYRRNPLLLNRDTEGSAELDAG